MILVYITLYRSLPLANDSSSTESDVVNMCIGKARDYIEILSIR